MAIFFNRMTSTGSGDFIMERVRYFEEYIKGAFTKIVVYVDTEEELLEIHEKAKAAGIHCSLIQDKGLTEFDNIPTYTAVGIGPWNCPEIDEITGHLKLL